MADRAPPTPVRRCDCLRDRALARWPGGATGESGEAPPVAEEACRFRGSGTIGGPDRGRESFRRNGGKFRRWRRRASFLSAFAMPVAFCLRRVTFLTEEKSPKVRLEPAVLRTPFA